MEQSNNPEEETHEEDLSYNAEPMVSAACCCGAMLDSELEMRDDIREVVVHRMALYDDGELAKILAFLAMYPSLAKVGEVVCSIKEYIDELEND